MTRLEQKKVFIHVLAEYLAGTNQVRKSIEIEMGKQSGLEWSELRSATPLFGYPSVEEAKQQLTEFLG